MTVRIEYAPIASSAETLRRQVAEAAERARRLGRPIVVSQTVPAPEALARDPAAFFARGAGRYAHRAYWERPAEGVALVGLGAARLIRCDGDDRERFRQAAAAIRDDLATALIDGPGGEINSADGAAGPAYLGGFAFDPARPASPEWDGYPAAMLFLPRYLLAVRGAMAWLTMSLLVEPGAAGDAEAEAALRELAGLQAPGAAPSVSPGEGSPRMVGEVPDPVAWQATVANTAADIRAGRFEKVVLARTLRLQAGSPFDAAGALRALRVAYPSAYVFAVASGARCFLGATPELLVRLTGRDVEATCLAGSIGRGATAEEDERLARRLLDSAKDQVEHRIVVRAIQGALAAVCDDLLVGAGPPRLLRVANVQHLYTPVRGRLAGDRCVLDLVERLHPTPAVGGYPRDVALAAIREREGFDRGWYAGPVGWVGPAGGEFAVAIRSALLAGDAATLYAGCGIVGDSDPAAEYAETGLKFRPMLAALARTED